MVQIIAGEKGKGKTKILLDKVNSDVLTSKGTIVYLDKSNKHMYELNNKIRLINVNDYCIECASEFVGFICGIISLVLMIVPTFMNVDKFKQINVILGLIALILAIVVVICGILFYTQSWTALGVTIKLTDIYKIGIGFWLVLIGGIITMVGGLMPIIKEKLM